MSGERTSAGRVVALAGGIGGARLLDGLAAVLPEGSLVAVVNTGDDFEHLGLSISPDLDTVMYTLAGLADPARGWGLVDETFRAMESVARFGGDAWFALGDRDLGTHLVRTAALRAGERLTDITARLCRSLGVRTPVLPMSDAPRRTIVETVEHGPMSFQDWLVRTRAQHAARAVRYEGTTEPTAEVLEALSAADLVVFCPSNPYVSVDPILGLDGVRAIVAEKRVVALSPIVHGKTVKGPLAAMLRDIEGLEPSAEAIVRHYGGLVRGLVVEEGDEGGISCPTLATRTVMGGREDRARLARELLAFAERLA